jgi:hypothetical protein
MNEALKLLEGVMALVGVTLLVLVFYGEINVSMFVILAFFWVPFLFYTLVLIIGGLLFAYLIEKKEDETKKSSDKFIDKLIADLKDKDKTVE